MIDTCHECGNKLKPGEFITCTECAEVTRIIQSRLARVKKDACKTVRENRQKDRAK
jgi:hypothetical protein